jgi:hypothetical protein
MSIFGVDIAGIVSGALSGNLLTATLTRTETEYDPIQDEQIEVVETYATDGIVSSYSDEMIANGKATEKERKILLVAQQLGTEPRIGDEITIESKTYLVTGVPSRDPAKATWTIRAEIA